MTNGVNGEAVARVSALTGEPAWLAERRREALARFEALPWPTQELEQWRNTDLRAFPLDAMDVLPGDGSVVEPPRDGSLAGAAAQYDGGALGGWIDPALEQRGVVFTSLARAALERPELVEQWLGRAGVSDYEAKIEALAAALWSGATFLYVPPGVDVVAPVRTVRHLSAAGRAVFPRVIVVADEASSVTYIEEYRSTPLGGPAVCVASVELYAAPAANLTYLSVQDWSQDVWHLKVQRALVDRDATVRSLEASLGAAFSRSTVESILAGEGGHAEMLGVYFADREQFVDNRTLQAHRAPNTSSVLRYKGALKGRARAVYMGLVDIEKDARRSDAQQENRNLLLSPHASALPEPFLEIKTSEVARATHGVSVGRPDPEVLFYLQSRGLDRDAAERAYVTGYFQELIDRVRVAQVREELERAIEGELEMEDA